MFTRRCATTAVRKICAHLAVISLALGLSVGVNAQHAIPVRAAPPRAIPPCRSINSPRDLSAIQADSLEVIGQGYDCLRRRYIGGARQMNRTLLQAAFAAIRSQLGHALDGIAEPVLSGSEAADWQAFGTYFKQVTARAPGAIGPLVEGSLEAMAAALDDDHTGYLPPPYMRLEVSTLADTVPVPSLGLITSPIARTTTTLFVTGVIVRSPVADAGIRPGDVIEAVDDQPPLAYGGAGYLRLLIPQIRVPVSLSILRPSTGHRFIARCTPRLMIPPSSEARTVAGTIAYVRLYDFTYDAYRRVRGAIAGLHLGGVLGGLILDLRGNAGGAADQAVRIASMFVHGHTVAVTAGRDGVHRPQQADASVPLVGVPVVVLVDAGSASSSEIVAAAVRDYRAGRVIGERTAGALAGADFFGLVNGGGFEITTERVFGGKGETIDRVGVPPDIRMHATAADLSQGSDPVIDRAVIALQHAGSGA